MILISPLGCPGRDNECELKQTHTVFSQHPETD